MIAERASAEGDLRHLLILEERVFNVGGEGLNHRIGDVARIVAEAVAGAESLAVAEISSGEG